MAVIDTDAIKDLTYRLLENGNADSTGTGLLTSQFSIQEIIDSMNRVQQDFLLETGMIVTRASITPAVGQSKYNLPADSIRPRRVTWQEPDLIPTGSVTGITIANIGSFYAVSDLITPIQSGAAGCVLYVNNTTGGSAIGQTGGVTGVAIQQAGVRYSVANGLPASGGSGTGCTLNITSITAVPNGPIRALTQVDTWELDNGMRNWPTDRDIPIAWWETTLPQQQLAIAKVPSNNGSIGLLYVALAQTLTGAGVTFAVPDDWTPYILYGTLAELLASDGPSFDPVRAGYCSQRYQEGIELARIVLGGM